MPAIAEKIAAAAEARTRYRVALFGPAGNACGVWVRTGRAVAETWIATHAVVHRDTLIRRMALAIIDLVDQHTRCTMADLTRRDFTADEVREFHEAACARAGEMVGMTPFRRVEGV